MNTFQGIANNNIKKTIPFKVKGCFTALVTPFKKGKVDFKSLKSLIQFQVNSGIQGLIVCGSTGEGALLTKDEKFQVLKASIEFSQGKVPVIMGAGSPSTTEVVDNIQKAQEIGASAVLVISPYYVKPPQSALQGHFERVHDETSLPIILYNHLGRTGVELYLETVCQLAKKERIIGLKDSSLDQSRTAILRARLGPDFALLSGDDIITAGYLAQGGDGCISVSSNAFPTQCQAMIQAWHAGDLKSFVRLRDWLTPFHELTSLEPNPIPIKTAVHLLGLCENEFCMPLLPAQTKTYHALKDFLDALRPV